MTYVAAAIDEINKPSMDHEYVNRSEQSTRPKIRHGPYGADVVGSIDKDEVKLVAVGVGYRQILFAVLLPKFDCNL